MTMVKEFLLLTPGRLPRLLRQPRCDWQGWDRHHGREVLLAHRHGHAEGHTGAERNIEGM
jgi:hypothetical protein